MKIRLPSPHAHEYLTKLSGTAKHIGMLLRVAAMLLLISCTKGYDEADSLGAVRILAIGNSFSANAVEQNLYELAADGGYRCEIGNLYFGGCSLEQHVNHMRSDSKVYDYRKVVRGKLSRRSGVSMQEALSDGRWDIVSVQQASHFSGMYDTYRAWLDELLGYIRLYAPDAKIVWHQTWAYAENSTHAGFVTYGNSQQNMYDAIVDASRRVMTDYGLDIIVPAGTAVQNLRATDAGDELTQDGYHLNTLGCFTAACAWYEALFGDDVRDNAYTRRDLSRESQRMAKKAAHAAVEQPYAVTNGD